MGHKRGNTKARQEVRAVAQVPLNHTTPTCTWRAVDLESRVPGSISVLRVSPFWAYCKMAPVFKVPERCLVSCLKFEYYTGIPRPWSSSK